MNVLSFGLEILINSTTFSPFCYQRVYSRRWFPYRFICEARLQNSGKRKPSRIDLFEFVWIILCNFKPYHLWRARSENIFLILKRTESLDIGMHWKFYDQVRACHQVGAYIPGFISNPGTKRIVEQKSCWECLKRSGNIINRKSINFYRDIDVRFCSYFFLIEKIDFEKRLLHFFTFEMGNK